jgi:hypothetical protein
VLTHHPQAPIPMGAERPSTSSLTGSTRR